MPSAFVSVINDLATDQRVNRTCLTLHKLGYSVRLIGRELNHSLPMPQRPYAHTRMKLLFTKGPLFYLEFNIRLFCFLLFKKADLLVANDLDTLLPNYLVAKIKSCPLVYDSHEYFTEVPELQNNKLKKQIWERLEKWIVPKLRYAITVNDSIAALYKKKYNINFSVVRNIPLEPDMLIRKKREELGLPTDKKLIILQGSGINIQRGAEEAVESMQYIENALLLIIGGGDVMEALKKSIHQLHLEEKVKLISKLPYIELLQYTCNADIGLTLDKDTNINYRHSLPNKLFDYIHCSVPILASDLPEIKKIVTTFNIGTLIKNHDPKNIAEKINFMLSDKERLNEWKENSRIAAKILSWENEEKALILIFNNLV